MNKKRLPTKAAKELCARIILKSRRLDFSIPLRSKDVDELINSVTTNEAKNISSLVIVHSLNKFSSEDSPLSSSQIFYTLLLDIRKNEKPSIFINEKNLKRFLGYISDDISIEMFVKEANDANKPPTFTRFNRSMVYSFVLTKEYYEDENKLDVSKIWAIGILFLYSDGKCHFRFGIDHENTTILDGEYTIDSQKDILIGEVINREKNILLYVTVFLGKFSIKKLTNGYVSHSTNPLFFLLGVLEDFPDDGKYKFPEDLLSLVPNMGLSI